MNAKFRPASIGLDHAFNESIRFIADKLHPYKSLKKTLSNARMKRVETSHSFHEFRAAVSSFSSINLILRAMNNICS